MFHHELPTKKDYYDHQNGTVRIVFRDILDDISRDVAALPRDCSPERLLLPLAERLFRRPAFYPHAEREWGFALYAVVRTRTVWEQDVTPRLRPARREAAAAVTRILLELEDSYSKVLTLEPEELSQFTAAYLHDKTAFMGNLPRRPINFELIRTEADRKRSAILETLGQRLEACGMFVPEVGIQTRDYGEE